jgi:hypothetical protein
MACIAFFAVRPVVAGSLGWSGLVSLVSGGWEDAGVHSGRRVRTLAGE